MTKTFFSSGTESIIFLLNSTTCLKVFYLDDSESIAKNEFTEMSALYDYGINVPKQFELTSEKILNSDLFGKRIRSIYDGWSVTMNNKYLIGEHPAIKKEFIPGSQLGTFFLPNKEISANAIQLLHSISDAGRSLKDYSNYRNFIVRSDNQVFLIDGSSLYHRNYKPTKYQWPNVLNDTFPLVTKFDVWKARIFNDQWHI